MSLQVFNFESVAISSIYLWVSLATATPIDPGYELFREVAFTSQQINFANEVCATQNPDQVFNRVRSKIECTVFAKELRDAQV